MTEEHYWVARSYPGPFTIECACGKKWWRFTEWGINRAWKRHLRKEQP